MPGTAAPPYPPQPTLALGELAGFLSTVAYARLATHNPDGTSHLAAVWFEYVDDAILLGTQAMTREVRNVGDDPHVTVLIDKPYVPSRGVMIHGTATLDSADPVTMRAEIFARFMPPDQAWGMAESMASAWEPALIRVVPNAVTSWDLAKPSAFV